MYYYFSLIHVHILYDIATSRDYKITWISAVGFEKEPFFSFSKGGCATVKGVVF